MIVCKNCDKEGHIENPHLAPGQPHYVQCDHCHGQGEIYPIHLFGDYPRRNVYRRIRNVITCTSPGLGLYYLGTAFVYGEDRTVLRHATRKFWVEVQTGVTPLTGDVAEYVAQVQPRGEE